MLDDDEVFGFIIMDGNGCLYGTVQGNNREVLHQFSVDLPKKHGRGGQSALRFARLRLEKRHNYIRKVAEFATQFFIRNGQKPNIRGLILAGSANFKTDLLRSSLFDQRLSQIVLKVVDVSYGSTHGFNQAIELSVETLGSVKLMEEKQLLQKFMEEISLDTGKYCFGCDNTMNALGMGAVENLIIFENLDTERIVLKNNSTSQDTVLFLTKEQQENPIFSRCAQSGVELEVIEKEPLVEWFASNLKCYGAKLNYVTDKSVEGTQFIRGFGGIGGILRWKVDFTGLHKYKDGDDEGSSSSDGNIGYDFDDGDFGF